MKYIRRTEKQFEKNWKAYEDQLEKYLMQKSQGDFKDWIQRKSDTGMVFWTHAVTLKSQVEHPGQTIFQKNKKILKAKAQQELEASMADINDRRMLIMETTIGLKDKVSKEVSEMRVNSAL